MAAIDTASELSGAIKAARRRVPEIKAHIRTRQKAADVKEGQRELAGLDDQLEKAAGLVAALGATPDPGPGPAPDPGPDEPDPPTIPGPWPETLPKPPDPSKVFKDATYSGDASKDAFLKLAGQKNVVYTRNRFIDTSRRILKGDAGRGVLLTDNFIDGLVDKGDHSHHCIFPGANWQTSDDVYELFCVGLTFGKNNQLEDEFEIKGSNVYVVGCQGPFSVRIRHGVGSIVWGNPDCWNTSVRCGPHLIGSMPKCKVVLYSGNLDGRKGHWEPDSGAPDSHDPGGGHNMQCAAMDSVVGVKEVSFGFHFGDNDKKYAPIDCIVDPSLQDKTKIIAGKPIFQPVTLPKFRAVKALESIRSRMDRDVAQAGRDERNREAEVYEWYMECVASSLKQAGLA